MLPTPMAAEPSSITRSLLLESGQTPQQRIERLLPLLYEQLRATAAGLLRGERKAHTLQATALVHEAYLKLVGPREIPWQSRAHFFAAAAEAMRHILLDYARAKATAKRGGPEARRAAAELDALPDPDSAEQSAGFLVLDEAITRLQAADPAAAAVVRMRYFAGLSVDDTASALGVSAPTVKRTWAFARAWLRDTIDRDLG